MYCTPAPLPHTSTSPPRSRTLHFAPLYIQLPETLISNTPYLIMSGVWVFNNGVVRLVENPANEQSSTVRRKVLLHTPTGEVIRSYASLERKLLDLGWERYYDDPELLQFHKSSSVDLISLPREFRQFRSMHMYDIVVKNRESFRVVDSS